MKEIIFPYHKKYEDRTFLKRTIALSDNPDDYPDRHILHPCNSEECEGKKTFHKANHQWMVCENCSKFTSIEPIRTSFLERIFG